ncbi:redoxin domain-containing protein [Blautia producta]|uniref:Redoxin domain-containing protein n=3 Tax=Blautia producta TaxID=33035 RepID=A0A7G5N3Q1_9FIRM|nr:redoxin family protein [Blautia producta ATCC 27340 = DSM 2950]QMW81494.1 redoxin domain-containing protein [Blautia producta]
MAVTAVVAAGVLAGCGNKEDDTAKTKAQTEESAESQKEGSAVSKSAGKDASEENVQAGEEEQQDAGTDNNQAETAQADTQADNTAEASEKNEIFGEFKTKTLDGEEVDQDIFAKADLTMVNIWGTFCGPCIREMPELGELSREYADKGFQMVGIISDVSQPEDDTALEIVKKTEADYTHLVIPKDANMQYRILKNAQVVPTTIFLDKDGNQVGDTYPGAKSKKQWTAVIDEMLEKVQNE